MRRRIPPGEASQPAGHVYVCMSPVPRSPPPDHPFRIQHWNKIGGWDAIAGVVYNVGAAALARPRHEVKFGLQPQTC